MEIETRIRTRMVDGEMQKWATVGIGNEQGRRISEALCKVHKSLLNSPPSPPASSLPSRVYIFEPWAASFSRKVLWETVSKALLKSR